MEAAATNWKNLQQSEWDQPASVKKFSSVPQHSLSPKSCYRCGQSDHYHSKCPHKELTCHYCHKKGHLSRVCLSRAKQKSSQSYSVKPKTYRSQTHAIVAGEKEPDVEDDLHVSCWTTTHGIQAPHTCSLQVEQETLEMEIDTGADVSIISETTYQQQFTHIELPVNVRYGERSFDLTLIVVAGMAQVFSNATGSRGFIWIGKGSIRQPQYNPQFQHSWINITLFSTTHWAPSQMKEPPCW